MPGDAADDAWRPAASRPRRRPQQPAGCQRASCIEADLAGQGAARGQRPLSEVADVAGMAASRRQPRLPWSSSGCRTTRQQRLGRDGRAAVRGSSWGSGHHGGSVVSRLVGRRQCPRCTVGSSPGCHRIGIGQGGRPSTSPAEPPHAQARRRSSPAARLGRAKESDLGLVHHQAARQTWYTCCDSRCRRRSSWRGGVGNVALSVSSSAARILQPSADGLHGADARRTHARAWPSYSIGSGPVVHWPSVSRITAAAY